MEKDYERVRFLRNSLNLSQTAFGERMGVSRNVVKNIEMNVVSMKEYIYKLISFTFHVNEQWLKTGEGEMFEKSETTILSELKEKYCLGKLDMALIEGYLELSEENKKAVKAYAYNVFFKMDSYAEKE